MSRFAQLEDFETVSTARLDRPIAEWLRGGSGDEVTLKDSTHAFVPFRLLPRVCVDITTVSCNTSVLSLPVPFPLGISPTAFHKLFSPSGELATARAASEAGTIFTVSSLASQDIGDISKATSEAKSSGSAGTVPGCPLWLQLYVHRDRERTNAFVSRAASLGFTAVVITVDGNVDFSRPNQTQAGFRIPPHITAVNFDAPTNSPVAGDSKDTPTPLHAISSMNQQKAQDFTWSELKQFAKDCPLPVIVKGVLSPEDAELACQCGVAAIWVSNHGGRMLDAAIPGIEVLADIVDMVHKRCEVYYDGGIRRGKDIFIALALGATCCFIGRPVLHGLVVDGTSGVKKVLDILKTEFEACMKLVGVRSVAEISRKHVKRMYASHL